MSRLIKLPTFSDDRGDLTVIEKLIPFEIRRVYYIYNSKNRRAGHRHKLNKQVLISVSGSCKIFVDNGKVNETVLLDEPNKCLLLEIEDWHEMYDFSSDCVLLVLASEYHDLNDYIDERYQYD